MILHAGLVAVRQGGAWRGALIEGPSGAGKSDLALRALEAGFRLVSDDRTIVWRSAARLFGRAPGPLAGLVELRGQGVLAEPVIAMAEIALAVVCAPPGADLDRTPAADTRLIDGVAIPRVTLIALEPSACAKLRRALAHLGAPGQQAYQAPSLGGGDRAGTGDTH